MEVDSHSFNSINKLVFKKERKEWRNDWWFCLAFWRGQKRRVLFYTIVQLKQINGYLYLVFQNTDKAFALWVMLIFFFFSSSLLLWIFQYTNTETAANRWQTKMLWVNCRYEHFYMDVLCQQNWCLQINLLAHQSFEF